MLNDKDLNKISKLARLKIPDDEKEHFLVKLNAVFEWIEQLSQIDVSNVNLDDILDETGSTPERLDLPYMCNTREELLSNTKDKKFDMFCVPKVVE